MITQDQLKKILHYDPETGLFTNAVTRSASAIKAKIAGATDGKGYRHTTIKGKFYRLHQLAFIYMGHPVPKVVDHINRVRTDNRWCNLRAANQKINSANSTLSRKNTSGYRGVSRNSSSGKWHAQIKIDGKQTYLGRRDTPEEAYELYVKAARDHFGEYLNA